MKWRLHPATFPEIERIGGLLGPTSALYGFNAFDGVVHILTKDAVEIDGTILQMSGGEFGTLMSAAVHSGRMNQWGYRLSAGLDQTHEWRDRDALAFRTYRTNLQTEYHPTPDSAFTLRGGFADVSHYDGPFSRGERHQSGPSFGYAYAQYESPHWLVHGWWNRMQDNWDLMPHPPLTDFVAFTDPQGVAKNDGRSDAYDVLAQYTSDLLDSEMTLGMNYRHATVDSNITDGFHNEDRLGLYLQDEWLIVPTLRFVTGLRYDLSSGRKPTLSPRVALIFRFFKDQTLRVTYSEAFRPPTLIDRHLDVVNVVTVPTPFGPITTTNPVQGSSNVEPEQIQSYELGYQGWFIQHRLRARANVFYNEISNLIGFPAISNPIRAVNIGEVDMYGGESGIEVWATSWLSGFINGAYQQFSQTVVNTPKSSGSLWKFNGGVRLDFPQGLSGELLVHYVSSTTYPIARVFTSLAPFGVQSPHPRVDSYTLVNLRAGYRFWDDRAEVAFSIYNALNDRHKQHPLGDTIGSRVLGWLTLKL